MNASAISIEGSLDIHVYASDEGNRVQLSSSRPILASRLFEGKSCNETLQTLPLIFNICGQAQGVAAVRAIESAQNMVPTHEVEHQRNQLVQLETLREHLWRVLLDWPGFTGTEADQSLLADLMRQIQAIRHRLDPRLTLTRTPGLTQTNGTIDAEQLRALQQSISLGLFCCPLDHWLAFDAKALHDWIADTDAPTTQLLRYVVEQGWADLGCTDTLPMPDLNDDDMIQRLDAHDAPAFIASPDWQGQNLETGPSARLATHPLLHELRQRHGQGLLMRLVARLIEIAQLAMENDRACTPPQETSNGLGISQLEAARGRLCHRIVLDGERIRRYRILAPTEWNFRPGGPAAQALAAVKADDAKTVRLQANMLIHAIDPCVSYQLSMGRA